MRCFGSLATSIAAIFFVFAMSPAPAFAKGTLSCKGDKVLDAPMQFAIDIQSPGRVHLSAYGGSDKSGYVVPSSWNLYDGSGRQVDSFPKSLLVFVSQNMLRETNLEGLIPGQSYSIELTSIDFCNNTKSVRQSLTMPAPSPEINPPALSSPTTVQVGLQTGQFMQIQFSVTDDTGVQHVAVKINGTTIQEYQYYNGVSFRWWCDNYPSDNAQSVLEGPNYYVSYPDSYKGQTAFVEVVTTDYFGNTTVTSASLSL